MRLFSSGTGVLCLGFLLISFGVSQAASLSDSLFSSYSFLSQQDSSYKATQSTNLKLVSSTISFAVSVPDETNKVLEILEYTIRDISAGGTYLQYRKPLAVSTPLLEWFFLPVERQEELNNVKTQIRVSGLVVRIDQGGMGVSFDEEYEIELFYRAALMNLKN